MHQSAQFSDGIESRVSYESHQDKFARARLYPPLYSEAKKYHQSIPRFHIITPSIKAATISDTIALNSEISLPHPLSIHFSINEQIKFVNVVCIEGATVDVCKFDDV